MTAPRDIDSKNFLADLLSQASPDLMPQMLATFVNALFSAEADFVCGVAYGARTDERTNRRNGYRHRDLDTRAGPLDVAIPKLREGSYFPEWLLERRRRAEAALTTVVATSGHLPARSAWGTTCSVCPRGGWTNWCKLLASPACRNRRFRR